jgi:hypothetical protein
MKTLTIILAVCQPMTGNWTGPKPEYPCAGENIPEHHQFICINSTTCVPLKGKSK